ncbi:hypothetical protein F5887DRAFT_924145 [Amanita rubescens]|nr:hypothetical protein F5887DRAFT_924145 [Amanita rubescens]
MTEDGGDIMGGDGLQPRGKRQTWLIELAFGSSKRACRRPDGEKAGAARERKTAVQGAIKIVVVIGARERKTPRGTGVSLRSEESRLTSRKPWNQVLVPLPPCLLASRASSYLVSLAYFLTPRAHPTSRFFALKTSQKRALPASEQATVQERTCQALRDYASNVRAVFGNDQEVDWVVVGKAHDRGTDGRFGAHWTVRGFQDGYAKFTFHVFRRSRKARAFDNGGKNSRRVKLDVNRKCYPLRRIASERGGQEMNGTG